MVVDSKYSSDLSYSMNSTAGSVDKTPFVVPFRTGHIVAELTSFECNGSENRLFPTKLDFSSLKCQKINHAISIHRQSRSSGNPRINMANNCRFELEFVLCVDQSMDQSLPFDDRSFQIVNGEISNVHLRNEIGFDVLCFECIPRRLQKSHPFRATGCVSE